MSRQLIGVAIMVLALATVAMAADDPFCGIWNVNLAKSKFAPGFDPKSETIRVVARENGMFKETIDGIDPVWHP